MGVKSIANFYINESMFNNRKDYNHALLLTKTSLFTGVFSGIFIVLGYYFDFEKAIYLMIFNFIGYNLLPFCFRIKFSNTTVGNIFISIGTLAVVILTYYSGGIWSGSLLWLILIPIIALILVNSRSAAIWTIVIFILLLYFIIKTVMGFEFPIEYDLENKTHWFSSVVLSLYLILSGIIFLFEKNRNDALNSIMQENQLLKHQKNKIEVQSNELRKVIDDKDTLIRIIAHDLKSPLGNITSLTNFLKKEVSGEDQIKYIDLIDQSANKSQDLVLKILSGEESKKDVYDIQMERLDINELLNNSIDLVSESAAIKSIQLIRSKLDKKCFSLIDPTYFSLIIENILSNAIKFSPPKGKIFIGLNKMSKKTLITIKDNGPGFNEDDKRKMFGKFERLSAKPTAGEHSTGLGLSLVKKYVELLGGQVWCESTSGKGATFFVELKNH